MALVRAGGRVSFALLGADATERQWHSCPWLEGLLTGEDKDVKRKDIVMLTHPLLRFQAGESFDEAIGKRLRYRGEDHTVGAG